jgi:hypothetical protein
MPDDERDPREPDDGGSEQTETDGATEEDEAHADEAGTGYTDHDKTDADSFPASDPPAY